MRATQAMSRRRPTPLSISGVQDDSVYSSMENSWMCSAGGSTTAPAVLNKGPFSESFASWSPNSTWSPTAAKQGLQTCGYPAVVGASVPRTPSTAVPTPSSQSMQAFSPPSLALASLLAEPTSRISPTDGVSGRERWADMEDEEQPPLDVMREGSHALHAPKRPHAMATVEQQMPPETRQQVQLPQVWQHQYRYGVEMAAMQSQSFGFVNSYGSSYAANAYGQEYLVQPTQTPSPAPGPPAFWPIVPAPTQGPPTPAPLHTPITDSPIVPCVANAPAPKFAPPAAPPGPLPFWTDQAGVPAPPAMAPVGVSAPLYYGPPPVLA